MKALEILKMELPNRLQVYEEKIIITIEGVFYKELSSQLEWFEHFNTKPDIIYRTYTDGGDVYHQFFRRGTNLKFVIDRRHNLVNYNSQSLIEKYRLCKDYITAKLGEDVFLQNEEEDDYCEVSYNVIGGRGL